MAEPHPPVTLSHLLARNSFTAPAVGTEAELLLQRVLRTALGAQPQKLGHKVLTALLKSVAPPSTSLAREKINKISEIPELHVLSPRGPFAPDLVIYDSDGKPRVVIEVKINAKWNVTSLQTMFGVATWSPSMEENQKAKENLAVPLELWEKVVTAYNNGDTLNKYTRTRSKAKGLMQLDAYYLCHKWKLNPPPRTERRTGSDNPGTFSEAEPDELLIEGRGRPEDESESKSALVVKLDKSDESESKSALVVKLDKSDESELKNALVDNSADGPLWLVLHPNVEKGKEAARESVFVTEDVWQWVGFESFLSNLCACEYELFSGDTALALSGLIGMLASTLEAGHPGALQKLLDVSSRDIRLALSQNHGPLDPTRPVTLLVTRWIAKKYHKILTPDLQAAYVRYSLVSKVNNEGEDLRVRISLVDGCSVYVGTAGFHYWDYGPGIFSEPAGGDLYVLILKHSSSPECTCRPVAESLKDLRAERIGWSVSSEIFRQRLPLVADWNIEGGQLWSMPLFDATELSKLPKSKDPLDGLWKAHVAQVRKVLHALQGRKRRSVNRAAPQPAYAVVEQ